MITRDLLRALRNDLPMAFTLSQLGPNGPCAKLAEGRLRFICPHCGEFLAAVNPRNNLAHCFGCRKNINNIDLLRTSGYDFRAAVTALEKWLRLYQRQHTAFIMSIPTAKVIPKSGPSSTQIGALLQQELNLRSQPY
jgi:hypothetical protein